VSDFSLADLYAALDAERQARGLSWAQAARQISRQSEREAVGPVSASTVTSTRTKAVAEADGVLQMLLWLNRTPESFVPGHPHPDEPRFRLSPVSAHQILRFDTRKLYAALNARRTERTMTSAQVAREIGVGVSGLTHLAKGGRITFPQVMRVVRWLDRPAAAFTRACNW
jgi:hypothetical protein